MTEHAQPISAKLGIAIFCAAMIVLVVDAGDVQWSMIALSLACGGLTWALSYVVVYAFEQYCYETGRLTRPYWMTRPTDFQGIDDLVTTGPVDLFPNLPVITGFDGNTQPVDDGMLSSFTVLANAINEGMDRISKRQLATYGVIPDRLSEEGDVIINTLVEKHLIDDIGNSQYAVTERLKAFLSSITGVNYDKRIRAN